MLLREGTGRGARVADEVGQANAPVTIAKQVEIAEALDTLIELGHALQVPDRVLGQPAVPEAGNGEGGFRHRPEDALKVLQGVAVGQGAHVRERQRTAVFGDVESAIVGADQMAASRGTVCVFLIAESCGEQAPAMR